jgi:hypothetical protein
MQGREFISWWLHRQKAPVSVSKLKNAPKMMMSQSLTGLWEISFTFNDWASEAIYQVSIYFNVFF